MNKRVLFGVAIVLIALAVLMVLVRKINLPWQIKAGKFASASALSNCPIIVISFAKP